MYAIRSYYATADFELLSLVRFHPKAIEAGLNALRSGCHIVTDTQMAKKGIPYRRITSYNVCYTKLLRALSPASTALG